MAAVVPATAQDTPPKAAVSGTQRTEEDLESSRPRRRSRSHSDGLGASLASESTLVKQSSKSTRDLTRRERRRASVADPRSSRRHSSSRDHHRSRRSSDGERPHRESSSKSRRSSDGERPQRESSSKSRRSSDHRSSDGRHRRSSDRSSDGEHRRSSDSESHKKHSRSKRIDGRDSTGKASTIVSGKASGLVLHRATTREVNGKPSVKSEYALDEDKPDKSHKLRDVDSDSVSTSSYAGDDSRCVKWADHNGKSLEDVRIMEPSMHTAEMAWEEGDTFRGQSPPCCTIS